jgi:protein gp37
MADRSKIEWTDASWNPIRARNKTTGRTGWHCEHVSEGCRNCYAEGFNRRLGTGLAFKPGALSHEDAELFLDESLLTQPLRWKRPRRIFVCSMTDLFSRFVPDEWIDKIFAVMALCPQHTFQVLTKRSERMKNYVSAIVETFHASPIGMDERFGGLCVDLSGSPCAAGAFEEIDWPLPNVWLGISAEDQGTADRRIPELLRTPSAMRFVSLEPLLGPIDLTWLAEPDDDKDGVIDALTGRNWIEETSGSATLQRVWRHPGQCWKRFVGDPYFHLDWVIVGGESGPNARPMHPEWARSLRDQCIAAGAAFFFKQWGEWAPANSAFGADVAEQLAALQIDDRPDSWRVGKRAAGRLLDGIEHDAFPTRGD